MKKKSKPKPSYLDEVFNVIGWHPTPSTIFSTGVEEFFSLSALGFGQVFEPGGLRGRFAFLVRPLAGFFGMRSPVLVFDSALQLRRPSLVSA